MAIRAALRDRASSELVVGKDLVKPMTGIEIWRRKRVAVKALFGADHAGAAVSTDLWSRERMRVMVGAGVVHPVKAPLGSDWTPVATVGIRW